MLCKNPDCSVDTDNPKFCSRSCAATVNNRKNPKRQPQGSCAQCDKRISTSRKYCSKSCIDEARPPAQTKEEYNAYMREYMLSRYKKIRAKGIQQLGGKCILCRSTKDLEFDHVDPNDKSFTIASGWSYSADTLEEEISKCQLLCHDCHKAKTLEEGSLNTTDDDKVYECCDKKFSSTRSYNGHIRWCKER